MMDLGDLVVPAFAVAVTACIAWGTARGVSRLCRPGSPGRSRALLWSLVPGFVGGFFAYVDGAGQEFIGFLLTFALAGLMSCIAIALWLPGATRGLFGTALFELVAAVAWGYVAVWCAILVLHGMA